MPITASKSEISKAHKTTAAWDGNLVALSESMCPCCSRTLFFPRVTRRFETCKKAKKEPKQLVSSASSLVERESQPSDMAGPDTPQEPSRSTESRDLVREDRAKAVLPWTSGRRKLPRLMELRVSAVSHRVRHLESESIWYSSASWEPKTLARACVYACQVDQRGDIHGTQERPSIAHRVRSEPRTAAETNRPSSCGEDQ